MSLDILTSTATVVNPQLTATIHNTLVDLLQLTLLGLSAAASYGVKIWINSMNSSWKKAIALRLVKFAEQRLLGNKEKLDYVAKKLHEHFPRLGEEEISQLIEEAVADLPSSNVEPVIPVVSVTTVTPTAETSSK